MLHLVQTGCSIFFAVARSIRIWAGLRGIILQLSLLLQSLINKATQLDLQLLSLR